MTQSLTRQLLEPLLTPPDDPGDPVLAAIRNLLLDHVGVTAWGAGSEIAAVMRAHVTGDLDRRTGPELGMFGTGEQASAVEAAMANAVAAACFEFDDTHTAGSTHPGAVVFPAALAAAALSGCNERRFTAAVIAGYEVMCRVARAVNPHAHRARHFHPTSTTGHFGAAAALGLAGTVAGGSMQFLVEGAVTKQLHPAYAVQRGVQAAQLAGRGFPGLADPIGGSRGFLAAQSADPRPERLLEGLGTAPAEITRTGVKPYPSCRNTQSPADALFSLLDRTPVRAEEVEWVRFGLIKTGLATVWDPPEFRRRPATLAQAQFSMPFVAAVLLLDGELRPEQFRPERYADPAVLALMDRVECVPDPALDARYPASWPAWVEVATTDGRTLTGAAEHPRGDPDTPLSPAELRRKFDGLTGHCWDASRRDTVADAVARLPEPGTLATLLSLA